MVFARRSRKLWWLVTENDFCFSIIIVFSRLPTVSLTFNLFLTDMWLAKPHLIVTCIWFTIAKAMCRCQNEIFIQNGCPTEMSRIRLSSHICNPWPIFQICILAVDDTFKEWIFCIRCGPFSTNIFIYLCWYYWFFRWWLWRWSDNWNSKDRTIWCPADDYSFFTKDSNPYIIDYKVFPTIK